MIQFYLMLIVAAVFFQPPTCVIGFLVRFLWHPPRLWERINLRSREELITIAAERRRTLDPKTYGLDADSAKWLGLISSASGEDEDWQNVMALVQDDGSIKRCLESIDHAENKVPFSCDLLSGFMRAVWARLPKLTDDERARLGKFWERTTWQGWPLLMAHPLDGKVMFERGHIYKPYWIFGSDEILTTLAWLYLGYEVTGQRRYLWAYRALKWSQALALLAASPDVQMWLGRVYAMSAHNVHSKALIYHMGYKLTGSRVFYRACAQAYKRHGHYNATVCLLAGGVIDAPWYRLIAWALISDAVDKGMEPCPMVAEYWSCAGLPVRENGSPYLEMPSRRGDDFVWERKPHKGRLLDDAYRARRGLDVWFETQLLRGLW